MELYYYTTTDTLRFILEKGDIYATNIRYMNDSEEYINGVNELWLLINNESLVKKWLNQRKPGNLTYEGLKSKFTEAARQRNMQYTEFYSISFCKKNDLLSQWAIYARESGVSIKMNFVRDRYSFLTESAKDSDEKTEEKARFRGVDLPREVYYFTRDAMPEDQYESRAFDILDRLYQQSGEDPEENIDEQWKYISTYIKRYNFYQEAESRVVFQPGASALQPKVKYRCDKKVLKPYLDIECENGWPIWEIMIGPGFNQEVVYNSVIHFLDHSTVKNGVTNVRDYIQRVDSYFQPYASGLEKLGSYQKYKKLVSSFSGSEAVAGDELSTARIELGKMVKQICADVHADRRKKGLFKYIEAHYFTESGIVVSKSSIPYLF